MDPNSALSVVVNAICSSVRSLLSSCGLLKRNRRRDGPINRLPNELMQLIVAKLELDGDVNDLIRLRSVSTRWQAVVEDYCRMKKSLIVVMRQGKAKRSIIYAPSIKNRFFGFANTKDFSCLFLVRTQVSSQCLKSVENLFVNIEQLSIRCDDDYRFPDLVTYINSLDSLKQLDFEGPFDPALLALSPVLSKLVHFSFIPRGGFNETDFLQLAAQLGPSCVGVNFGFTREAAGSLHIRQWNNNNTISLPWLTSLTHLRMHILGEAVGQFVHFLCEHATSLKVMNLKFGYYDGLVLTPTVLRDLAKLTNLVELVLWFSRIHFFSELEQAATQPTQSGLTSLASILTCKLLVSLHSESLISAGQYVRVMSVILPNLTDLDLTIYGKSSVDSQFQHEIEQRHLKQFPNLRKHMFEVYT